MRSILRSLHIHAKKDTEVSRSGRDPKAFYLIAEPGYPNYGDELIAGEWLSLLGKYYPETPVVVDCARPGPAAVILRDKHPHAIFTDTLRRLGTENPFPYDGPIDDIAGFVGEALNDEGIAPNYASGIRLLQHGVQSIHMLGGGYMRGDWTCNLSRLAIGPWAHERNIPVAATGLGLMPIKGDSLRFAQQSVKSFDVFTVRDVPTQTALQGELMGDAADTVKVAPDDCFVNGLEGCYASPEGLPDVMVCIQSDFVVEQQALFEQVRRTLERWGVEKDDAIGVVECNPRIDYPILPYLSERGYSNLRFFPIIDVLEKGFPALLGNDGCPRGTIPIFLQPQRGVRDRLYRLIPAIMTSSMMLSYEWGPDGLKICLANLYPWLGLDSGMRFWRRNILHRLGEMSVQYILVWCELTV